MPLVKGYSNKSIAKNIEAEKVAGKPHKQRVAIALSVARRAAKKAGKAAKARALAKVKR